VRGLRRSRAFLMTTVLTLAVGVGLLATVLAAYQPARRATRVDPSHALRAEG
jgi:ABC-type antimicrobial peptide transport system permease subunit